MKSAIVVFPGSNRERDMAMALRRAGGREPVLVAHDETALPPSDLIALPGGFAHGDYLRAGAIAARAPVMRAVAERARAGAAVLGVCNGFQILAEAGLLPGALMRNAGLKFVCRDTALAVVTTDSPFTAGYAPGQRISVPCAHNDGNYQADEETLDRLEGEGLVAFRYAGPGGATNGSARAIAGILNPGRNVLGLMPHPENATDEAVGGVDGRPLFDSLAAALS